MTVETLIKKLQENYKLYYNTIYFENDFEIVDFAYDKQHGFLLFADNEFQGGITPKVLLPQLHKIWPKAEVTVIIESSFCPISEVSTIQYPGELKHINLLTSGINY